MSRSERSPLTRSTWPKRSSVQVDLTETDAVAARGADQLAADLCGDLPRAAEHLDGGEAQDRPALSAEVGLAGEVAQGTFLGTVVLAVVLDSEPDRRVGHVEEVRAHRVLQHGQRQAVE